MDENEKENSLEIDLVLFERPVLMIDESKQSKNSVVKKIHSSASGHELVPYDGLQFDDVLNRIRPPKVWRNENGEFLIQKISKQPVPASDVRLLGGKLDTLLYKFNAQEAGICPIKRELYAQCFNEIIRQVTLTCSERGCLLLEVRDELDMTIETYQELSESVIAYGIRKTLMREHKVSQTELQVEELRSANKRLEIELAETIVSTEEIVRLNKEEREAENLEHAKKIAILKKSNLLIKSRMESIITPKKIK